MSVPLLGPSSLDALARRHGGAIRNRAVGTVSRLAPTAFATAGDLTVLFDARYVEAAIEAVARGALLLVDEALVRRSDVSALPCWTHPYPSWAMSELLDAAAPLEEPVLGADCYIGPGAILLPGVRLGARVTIGPGAVVGAAGFGFALGEGGRRREIPQRGGVVVEDDVHIGALSTIASGTLGPTIVRRGAKLDAQVHVGHNCEIGEGTIIAAQSGLAGSVVVGKRVLIGGQVGIADHLRIGDGARIAAKSGVIGNVPAGATFAGYPATLRSRWFRGLAELYRFSERVGALRGRRSPEPWGDAGAESS